MTRTQVRLVVNGAEHELWIRSDRTLLNALHDDIGLPDVRYGCNEGVCGTCTVLLDGAPTSACLMYAVQAEGHEVTTLHGFADPTHEMHPLQKCFLERGGAQCGFCTPGILLTAKALADRKPDASREEIRYELVGNLCRCTGYTAIVDSIEAWMKGEHVEDDAADERQGRSSVGEDAVEAGA
jgi:aerobic-type carbon monoxide dehydrogenase small subunit (CoxS/CutS family)